MESGMKTIEKKNWLPRSIFALPVLVLFWWAPTIGSPNVVDPAKTSANVTKADIDSSIEYVSNYKIDNFPVFSTLVRTYKIVPIDEDIWPQPNSPVTYLGGRIVNLLAFSNIVMIIYDGKGDFGAITESSGASNGYIQRFNALFQRESKGANSCYFERYIARERWITKGVIIADLTKSNVDRKQLLMDCASAGADFINGLPFASNRATISDMPSARVRAAINNAIYRCSLKGSTNIMKPETSKDGLSERPSKTCVIDYLKDTRMKLGE